MKLVYKYAPLPKLWPGKQRPAGFARKRAPFKATTWSSTENMLARELAALGARDVVISIDVTNPGFFRTDGMLRSDARPATPAVIVSFTNRQNVRLQFPCDTFGYWQDNVRAIALSLESLRRVDRFEVTQGDQQYVGFRALPRSTTQETMTVEEAADVIAQHSPFPGYLLVTESSVAREAIKMAKRNSHPDAGGSDDAFTKVVAAADRLERAITEAQP